MSFQLLGLVLLASFCYSLQGSFYTKYSRIYGGRRVGMIRNIAMIITGLPFLIFANGIDFLSIYSFRIRIFITALISAIHVFISYEGYRYLPVGISQIVKQVVKVFMIFFLSVVVLNEVYTLQQILGLLIIIIGSLWLGVHKVDIEHLEQKNIGWGFFLVTLAGIASALSRFFVKKYSDTLDPVLSGYLLEAGTGIIFTIYGFIHFVYGYLKPITDDTEFIQRTSLSLKDTLWMICISFLPMIGTISVIFAFSYGGFGLTSILLILGIPISFLIALIMFNEKVTLQQLFPIAIVIVGLVVMKL